MFFLKDVGLGCKQKMHRPKRKKNNNFGWLFLEEGPKILTKMVQTQMFFSWEPKGTTPRPTLPKK